MRFWMRIRGHGRLTFNSLFYLDFVGGGVGVWLDQRNWSASLCGHSGLEGVGWARRVLLCVLIRWTWENRFICTGFTATVCLSPRLQPPSEVCRTFILFLFFILSQEKGAYCFLVNTPPTPLHPTAVCGSVPNPRERTENQRTDSRTFLHLTRPNQSTTPSGKSASDRLQKVKGASFKSLEYTTRWDAQDAGPNSAYTDTDLQNVQTG